MLEEYVNSAFISQIEPKKVDEELLDLDWILAMQEELNQSKRNKVWHLVPRPANQFVIRTRWDLRNKLDDITACRGIIDSLLYLIARRSDILFVVGVCGRYQDNSKQSHYIAAKRILKYLKGTQNVGLQYPKDSSFNVISYSDADYAGYKVDRKSTSGTCQFLGDRLVSWYCKKQTFVATLTAEANCSRQLLCSTTQDSITVTGFWYFSLVVPDIL